MAIRPIFETPDPVLRQISKPVETFDDELKKRDADWLERREQGRLVSGE